MAPMAPSRLLILKVALGTASVRSGRIGSEPIDLCRSATAPVYGHCSTSAQPTRRLQPESPRDRFRLISEARRRSPRHCSGQWLLGRKAVPRTNNRRCNRRACNTNRIASPAYPALHRFLTQPRRQAWESVIAFFAFPPRVRRVVYRNVIERLHMWASAVIKHRGRLTNDDAPIKLIWLALRSIIDGKVRSAREWKFTMNQFAVLCGHLFVS